jgi:hypothetical protein
MLYGESTGRVRVGKGKGKRVRVGKGREAREERGEGSLAVFV